MNTGLINPFPVTILKLNLLIFAQFSHIGHSYFYHTNVKYDIMQPDKIAICVPTSPKTDGTCRLDGNPAGANMLVLINQDNGNDMLLKDLREVSQSEAYSWYKVSLPDDQIGYVRTDLVQDK